MTANDPTVDWALLFPDSICTCSWHAPLSEDDLLGDPVAGDTRGNRQHIGASRTLRYVN